jgi:hypothetical protein
MSTRFTLRATIYLLLLLTFCLGVPQIHYSVAVMIAVIIKFKDSPEGLFTAIL